MQSVSRSPINSTTDIAFPGCWTSLKSRNHSFHFYGNLPENLQLCGRTLFGSSLPLCQSNCQFGTLNVTATHRQRALCTSDQCHFEVPILCRRSRKLGRSLVERNPKLFEIWWNSRGTIYFVVLGTTLVPEGNSDKIDREMRATATVHVCQQGVLKQHAAGGSEGMF